MRLPGLHLRRLRLHRHLPEVDSLAPHRHGFSQILCYLRGHGRLTAAGRHHDIVAGAVAFLPPGTLHSFREVPGRRPLCLVVDLDWRGARAVGPRVVKLWQSESGAIRRELSTLASLAEPGTAACRLLAGAAALRVGDVLLRALRILPPVARETPSFVRRVDRLLRESPPGRTTIRELAARAGYQADHLNRIFRNATGQSLREYRDALLVERAQQLLGRGLPVGQAAAQIGFPDQNYFARWFRTQTGLRPSDFLGAAAPDTSRRRVAASKRPAPTAKLRKK